jgi:RimJ/RimL family protein N-acetyltransferase
VGESDPHTLTLTHGFPPLLYNPRVLTITPVTLTGQHIRLEPLALAHVPALAVAGRDDSLWRYMPYGDTHNPAFMHNWVTEMLERQARGADLPFAVIHLASQTPIGATRYMDIHAADHGLEIGGTWYALEHQRTAANTEAKYLLLRHAFEVMGVIRVQLKTDLRNVHSQRAIEKLGAVREGVLRRYQIRSNGETRDTVMYSVLSDEWPDLKARLEARLADL